MFIAIDDIKSLIYYDRCKNICHIKLLNMTVVEILVMESFVLIYYDMYFVYFMTIFSHSKSTCYVSFSTNIEIAKFL